jgi:hypothetical protein
MKKLMSTLFVIAATAGMAMAANPDFSGTWKMDPDKSSFGPMPAPSSVVAKIDHKDPAFSMESTSDTGVQSVKYTTDGTETSNTMMGAPAKSTAKWEGKTLVVTSNIDAGGAQAKFVTTFSLSDDGKTLTQALKISAPQGDFDLSLVYVKQ